jgi:transcriptional regulator with XRE-family HTH domain
MRIKEIRQILNLSQEELAKFLKIKRPLISLVENGKRNLGKPALELLHQKFGINIDWLEGKTHILFIDWQKGLEILKGKSTLTRWELLFLLEVMHWVWSMPLYTDSTETRKEIISNLSQSIKHLLGLKIQNLDQLGLDNTLKLFGSNIFEALNAIERNPIATPSLARELASILIGILRDGNFEMAKKDEKEISDLLLPWGYYVALSYFVVKQDLIPLSSIYFIWDIPFNEKEKNEKTIENLLSSLQNPIQKENVYIEFREYAGEAKVDILIIGKGKITLDLDEIFGFFTAVTVMESEKRINFSVLKYSIQERNVTEKDIVIDKRYTIALTQNEYYCLIEIVREISENTDFWMYLQRIYLQKYGFV